MPSTTFSELSRLTNIGRHTLYKWFDSGRLPGHLSESGRRILADGALESLLDHQHRTTLIIGPLDWTSDSLPEWIRKWVTGLPLLWHEEIGSAEIEDLTEILNDWVKNRHLSAIVVATPDLPLQGFIQDHVPTIIQHGVSLHVLANRVRLTQPNQEASNV